MKVKSAVIAAVIALAVTGSAHAMMTTTGSGMGSGMMGGVTGNTGVAAGTSYGMGSGNAGIVAGPGYGMMGAGGMRSGMLLRTMNNGYLDLLTPITTPQDAVTAVQSFISAAKSSLKVSAVWEYKTVYKAELSDANGQKAFDVLADKLTGAVTPEMGFSMMMNASWGSQLQMTPKFGKKLTLTSDEATTAAQDFVSKNAAVINYNLAAPETYPGYYKFHTTDSASGNPGMDILVNGYNGRIWMNTQLGAPLSPVPYTP
jgi:hypothetical protein